MFWISGILGAFMVVSYRRSNPVKTFPSAVPVISSVFRTYGVLCSAV